MKNSTFKKFLIILLYLLDAGLFISIPFLSEDGNQVFFGLVSSLLTGYLCFTTTYIDNDE